MAIQFAETADCLHDRVLEAAESAESQNPESRRAATLRLIACALRDRDVSARARGEATGQCEDAEVKAFLRGLLAHREASAMAQEAAGQYDLAEEARAEMDIIREFLPAPLAGAALEAAVKEVVEDLEACKLKDMGRCMDALKARYSDRLDTCTAYKVVRSALR